jgi:hypothetical protein
MRKHKIVPLFLIALACAITAGSVATADEYRGTFAQRMACTPDVFRLCGSEIPDVNRIVACLKQNEQQLGGPCRAVFESNAQATPPDSRAPAAGTVGVAPPPARGDVRAPVR